MEEYLQWLNDNQWLNLVFLVLAVLSIIISIFLFRKSRKSKKPLFDKRSINVISERIKNIGGIQVNYKGENIDNLTVTKIAFWNGGNETLNESDQAPTDKLRIELNREYRVLEAEVIFQSDKTNNITIEHLSKEIGISFDYLDENQGGIIKFTHTGKNSSDVNLIGTFKGSHNLKRVNSGFFDLGISVIFKLPYFGTATDRLQKMKFFQKSFPWFVLLTGIGLSIGYFFSDREKPDSIALLVMGLVYLILGLIMVFSKTSMPKGFEVFYDDE